MTCWMTKANFAKEQQVPRNTVSWWIRQPDGPLVDALDARGDKIDADHQCVREFLASQARKYDKRTTASKRFAAGEDDGDDDDDSPSGPSPNFADSELIQQMTIAEVAKRFGGLPGFMEHVKAFNGLQDGRKKELSNLRTEGALVSRELVRAGVFSHLEQANRRLLTDIPETLARVVYGHCNAGDGIEVAKLTIRERIGQVLKELNDQTIKGFAELTQDGVDNDEPDAEALESGSGSG